MHPRTGTILDAIGNTPLIEIESGLWVKCEFLNPSGSIKARMAYYVIDRAEREGLLKKGDIIVEATSGNTGNAMAMVAAVKGYKMLVVMPRGFTQERTKITYAFGAEIKFMGHFQVNEAMAEAKRLGAQPGYFCPQQFDTEWNVDENRDWLGQEIIGQIPLGVRVDALVQGVGTGGTLIGVAQALRQGHNPDLQVFAMEPAESPTIGRGIVAEHKIEGIADGFVPAIYDRHAASINETLEVTGDEAVAVMLELARTKGLFVGPSSGGNVAAARALKARAPAVKNVLTFLCDEGEKYIMKYYS